MAVSILTITHGRVGHEFIATANTMLGNLPLNCETLSITDQCKPEKMLSKAKQLCEKIDNGDGIIVFTDIFGSTPSNICNKLKNESEFDIHVIAGLNLPMLVRVLNYPKLPLSKLVDKALSGAHDGIVDCHKNN